MSRAEPQRTQAIILRTRALGEADRIVTFLSETHGKCAGVAPSARRSQRRFGGGLGLGSCGTLLYTPRPGQSLVLLNEFHPLPPPPQADPPLAGAPHDLPRFAATGVWLNLVELMSMEHQTAAGRFALAQAGLTAIAARPPRGALVHALLHWLRHIGFAPTMDRCARCGTVLNAETAAWFTPADGGAVCAACHDHRHWTQPLPPEARAAWIALQGADLALPTPAWPPTSDPLFHTGLWQYVLHLLDRHPASEAYWEIVWG
ncbi:MAG: DNA repair protein RecO [Deltaproteobacteria bacterium]|nr:DNA repair protein RecO [Deltaproteobacteria bacterium]